MGIKPNPNYKPELALTATGLATALQSMLKQHSLPDATPIRIEWEGTLHTVRVQDILLHNGIIYINADFDR